MLKNTLNFIILVTLNSFQGLVSAEKMLKQACLSRQVQHEVSKVI